MQNIFFHLKSDVWLQSNQIVINLSAALCLPVMKVVYDSEGLRVGESVEQGHDKEGTLC